MSIIKPVLSTDITFDKSLTWTKNSFRERTPPCLTPLLSPKLEKFNIPHLTQSDT